MKRLLLLLSVLFVALALSACTIESVEEYEKSPNERIAKQEAQQEEDAIEEIEQTTRDTTIEDTTTASKEPETSTTTKKEETKSPAKPKEEPVQTPTKPQTTRPAPQTTSPSKVTISIDAKVLVNHMDKLKPALQNEKYIPKDGDKIEFKYTTDLGRDLGKKVPS